ncbi:DNA/RNA non-specific endonuclease [Simplicispira psychrophila]|uniref:DNA/RNA non-specific endonuclease n=1 Tax=Simplicispira psychrophila TaxID=80882 RepID=UPI000481E025|nr:DNA/RNA non-specific endonuclease [Simplicispira psychrophila]
MALPKKSPRRQATKSRLPWPLLRRTSVWLVTSGVVLFQASSCGVLPSLPLPGFERPSASAPAHKTGAVSKSTAALVPTSFKDCPQFFAGGVTPRTPPAPRLRELCYDAFAVLHSGNTRTPVFVAERLSRESTLAARGEKRTDRFFADARLPRAERAELSDYKGSGYARGHMAPAGNMPSASAMAQSFSLANMIPQNPKQNSGPWAKIENDTRQYALRAQGEVYVITGPVFAPGSPAIGSGQVAVPTHLFKLVYDPSTHKAWAHWQANSADARVGPPISYSELTQRIGMELLPKAAL